MPATLYLLILASFASAMLGCTAGGSADPARSEALAQSAAGAATAPVPRLASEEGIKRPVVPELSDTDRALRAALASPSRREADRARDQQRRAFEVLRFFGAQPGMAVLDIFSGGGYYTEILSTLVGAAGRVVAHNNSPYRELARAELTERYAPGRLPNVEQLIAENNQLRLPAGSFDLVLMTNVYHDIYFVDEARGWTRIDGPKLLAEIYQSMKPGAVLGIVDHAAVPGSPPGTGGTLHRIDPALLKRDLLAAGFILDAESDVLRNPLDERTRSVFDSAVRGQTDQVVLRFRKPAAR